MSVLERLISKYSLQILLGLALVGLLWQVDVGSVLTNVELFGLGQRSRTQWIVLNALALLLLVGYRLSPMILKSIGSRQAVVEHTAHQDVADDCEL